MRVYLALPSYNETYWGGTLMSVLTCGPIKNKSSLALPKGVQTDNEICPDPVSGSLLPRVFNEALGRAIVRKFDVFAMLHADVAAEPGWLTKMLLLRDHCDADVLSAVVAVKDNNNETSTAINTADVQFRRLSLQECWTKCQQTFDVHDPYLQQQGATTLLVNTGLMIIPLYRPWLRKWSGFQIRSRLVVSESGAVVDTLSEDWDMSEQLAALGCKIMATTAVKTAHRGTRIFTSDGGCASPTPPVG